jgi:hypothetical protein
MFGSVLFCLVTPGTEGSDPAPPPRKEVWGNGPIVNHSVVEVTVYEGFSDLSGPDFIIATGEGMEDLFFDPNYQWKEGGKKHYDLPYGNETFTAAYPAGVADKIDVTFSHYYTDVNFGWGTLHQSDPHFNSVVYHGQTGKDTIDITIFAENRSGISKATLKLSIMSVNDPPLKTSPEDSYSIAIPEDTSFWGINKKHTMPNMIWTDPYDPTDVLTFKVDPANDLASSIEVVLEPDGSNITFTPEANWSSPYLPAKDRLAGENYKGGWTDYFAKFIFNVTDQFGAMVSDQKDTWFYVYVIPVNDEPSMTDLGTVKVKEDTLARITYSGTDPDLEYDQSIRFNHDLSDVLYDETGVQIEFTEGYLWDPEEGSIRFRTSNELVGSYNITAWTRDRSTLEQTPPDYAPTPYPIYANYTLVIENVNDDPIARIDSPSANFPYNTSADIEFNGTSSYDPDMIHGSVLNYTWRMNGVIIGYEALFEKVVPQEGIYNVELNVTDGIASHKESVRVEIKKARIWGEIFKGKVLDTNFTDQSKDQLVLLHSQKRIAITYGGQDSIDVLSIRGKKEGEMSYQITARFDRPLDFVFTEEKKQYPTFNIYFVKPSSVELAPLITPEMVPGYSFDHPPAGYRYARIEIDLRTMTVLYKGATVFPQVQPFMDRTGVIVTLTLVELDQLSVQPDFDLFARAYVLTEVTDATGGVTKTQSYDTIGYNASAPVTIPTEKTDVTGKGSGLSTGTLVLIGVVIILLLIIIVAAVLGFILTRKKEPEAPPSPIVKPEDELDLLMRTPAKPTLAPAPQPQGIQPALAPQSAPALPAAQDEMAGASAPPPDNPT